MSNARQPSPAATVLVNGSIHRLPGDPEPAPAMAVRDGQVVAVGAVEQTRAALPGAAVIDLRGRTVLPAFIDSHTHFHRAAVLRQLYLDFESLAPPDIAAVLALVGERAVASASGSWVQGDSISPARLAEGRLPDRYELDAVSGDHPVIIRGIGKHVIAANSLALASAGISRETPDPPGGRIERDADGEPNGILHERAKLRLDASATDTVVPKATKSERLGALQDGIAMLHQLGIATIHEQVRQPEEAADFAELHVGGELGLRVRLYYRVHESPISLDWLIALGLRQGWGDDWLRIAGVKVSVDGWCIFHNAAVYEPYLEEPANTGLLRVEPDVLDDLVARADAAGLGVAVHAVGARAVDAALHAFESAQPVRGGPHRIEHAHLDVDEARLRRMEELSLVLSAQPSFLDAYRLDWEGGLQPSRIEQMMPLGSARRLGIRILINSDMPSGPVGPLRAIAAAVAPPAGTRTPEAQSLSITAAWRAHSSNAADVIADAATGYLEPGRRADLVVIDGDPFRPGGTIPAAVGATVVDGAVVHDPDGWLS